MLIDHKLHNIPNLISNRSHTNPRIQTNLILIIHRSNTNLHLVLITHWCHTNLILFIHWSKSNFFLIRHWSNTDPILLWYGRPYIKSAPSDHLFGMFIWTHILLLHFPSLSCVSYHHKLSHPSPFRVIQNLKPSDCGQQHTVGEIEYWVMWLMGWCEEKQSM